MEKKTEELLVGGYMVLLILAVWGWVFNIVALCHCDFASPYKAEVIRSIGVVVSPVGVVAGYLTIEDGPDKEEP